MSDANPLLGLVPPGRSTIPALFAARVERTPEAAFLRWQGDTWSYREAWEEARRFAAWVRGRCPQDAAPRVAGFLPNRPEALWAWFGTLVAGGVYVPLNRAHRGEILADMVGRAGARAVVTDAAGLADLPATGDRAVLADWDEVRGLPPATPATPGPGDLAELMYTSGTTGRSKAAELSHNQLCRGAGWVARSLGLSGEDTFHLWLPLFHIAGQADAVLPTVIGGGAVALYPTFSRSRFWDQVAETGATVTVGFPNLYRLLHALPARAEDADTPLRAGITATMPPEFVASFEGRFGVELHDIYGMTEAEPVLLREPGAKPPPGSCGRPNPDLEVGVLDPAGKPVAAGELGEIAFRPRAAHVITSGYEGDPEATAAAFQDGWFLSGDLGRVDRDGFFYFVDRIKHSIRRRGESISSAELESIIEGHGAVAEACALGVPSPLGEEDVKLVVVPRDGAALEPAALRAWCAGRMAAFMLPRYIEVRAGLPRAATGKVMKGELRDLGAATWDAEATSQG